MMIMICLSKKSQSSNAGLATSLMLQDQAPYPLNSASLSYASVTSSA